MSAEPRKPLASQALLDYLETLYPAPDTFRWLTLPYRELDFNAGQRSVVDKLKLDLKQETARKEE